MWVWSENNERVRSWGTLLGLQQFGGKGACWSSRMGTMKNDKHQLFTQTCTNQTTSWLVHILNAFGVRTRNGQTLIHKIHHCPDLGETTTFPPYSILCAWSWGQHPNVILSRDSHLGVPKFPKLGLPKLCGAITLCEDFRSRWGLKKSYGPRRELSNGMSHATCTQGNWGNSWLLMVGNQFGNLIFDPSFGHKLYFKCPNESCNLILDIYVSRSFQWYKKLFNPMGFVPWNRSMKIRESNFQSGCSLGSVEVQFSHFPILSTSWEHEMWLTNFTFSPHLCKPLRWSWAQG
jgi:hypothetical protein